MQNVIPPLSQRPRERRPGEQNAKNRARRYQETESIAAGGNGRSEASGSRQSQSETLGTVIDVKA